MTWGEWVGYQTPYYLNRTPQQLANYRKVAPNTVISGMVELGGMVGSYPVLKPGVSIAIANAGGVDRNVRSTVDTASTGM